MSDVSAVGPSASVSDLLAPPPAATAAAADKTSMGKDAFLKLLVAQLKYQNPLSPSDPGEFLAQTAQFTMVEKLEELARQGSDGALAQRVATASALVGRNVTYTDTGGVPRTGLVASAHVADGTTVLRVGEVDVPLEKVTAIAPAGS